MPVQGQGQPDVMPFLRFRCDECIALENGTSPSSVVTAPTPLQLRMDLGFDGQFTGLLNNQRFSVVHHVERVEDNLRKVLQGGSFVVPAPAAASHITVTSNNFSTGAAGSGADFEIAPGFASGTFRILSHIHADNPNVRPIVSAFHDGLVIQVT